MASEKRKLESNWADDEPELSPAYIGAGTREGQAKMAFRHREFPSPFPFIILTYLETRKSFLILWVNSRPDYYSIMKI